MRWVGVVLLSSIALLPLLSVLSVLVPSLAPVERLFRPWFELHCERDPARTLRLWGVPFGVCARCSGIYFGLGLGAAVRRPRLSASALRGWVLAAVALMLADVALERYGLHGPAASWRVLTGLLLAYPVGAGLALLAQGAPTLTPAQKAP
jgi:uncharacterized membrane protein